MVIKNFDNFIIEEVNQPKLSEFDLRVLSYGLAECCIKAFNNPEMQKKFAEWKKKKGIEDKQLELPQKTLFSSIPIAPPTQKENTLC